LSSIDESGWLEADLSNLSHAPDAAGSPFAYLAPSTAGGEARVVYVGKDSHVHEIKLTGSGWVHTDISVPRQAKPAHCERLTRTPGTPAPRAAGAPARDRSG
jgi:hypothetical protein